MFVQLGSAAAALPSTVLQKAYCDYSHFLLVSPGIHTFYSHLQWFKPNLIRKELSFKSGQLLHIGH